MPTEQWVQTKEFGEGLLKSDRIGQISKQNHFLERLQ